MLVDNMFNESPLFVLRNTYGFSLINNFTNGFDTRIALQPLNVLNLWISRL